MASMWRKAMLYLGLGPDDEYDDFDVTGEHQRAAAARPVVDAPAASASTIPSRRARCARCRRPTTRSTAAVRPGQRPRRPRHAARRTGRPRPRVDRHRVRAERPAGTVGVRRPPSTLEPSVAGRTAVVRPLPAASAPSPSWSGPRSFNDAQEVADKFKINVPVILNLQGVERDLARRIIDFASGLCYGLGGQMERVANQVYLLTPSDVEVSPEERRRLHERGYEA